MLFSINRASSDRVQPCDGAYVEGETRSWVLADWGARWVIDIPDLPALLALRATLDEALIVAEPLEHQRGAETVGHLTIYDDCLE